MEAEEVLLRVLSLPNAMKTEDNVSPWSLVLESRYSDYATDITESRIHSALLKHPERITEWFQYSEDQRSTPSWYLMEKPGGQYEIGFLDRKHCTSNVQVFEERAEACAAFIKRALDQIAEIK